MTTQITQEKAEQALNYLASTDEGYATAKSYALAADKLRKAKRAECYRKSEEKTVQGKAAYAECHPDYMKSIEEWQNAMLDYEFLKAKRDRAVLTIEFWRSLNSAQKKGNIV